jgi:hypothetical protein
MTVYHDGTTHYKYMLEFLISEHSKVVLFMSITNKVNETLLVPGQNSSLTQLYFANIQGTLGTNLSSLIPITLQSDTIPTPSEAVSNPYKIVPHLSLFLIALGCGGVRSSLLPLGANQ